jgi:hypothetical protein
MIHLLALVILIGYGGGLVLVTIDVTRVVLGGAEWQTPRWTGPLSISLMVVSVVLACAVLVTR